MAVPQYIDVREHEMTQEQAEKYLYGLVTAEKIKIPILLVLCFIALVFGVLTIFFCKKYKKELDYQQSLPGAFDTKYLGDTSLFQKAQINDSMVRSSKRGKSTGSISRRASDSAFDDILNEREEASNDAKNGRA